MVGVSTVQPSNLQKNTSTPCQECAHSSLLAWMRTTAACTMCLHPTWEQNRSLQPCMVRTKYIEQQERTHHITLPFRPSFTKLRRFSCLSSLGLHVHVLCCSRSSKAGFKSARSGNCRPVRGCSSKSRIQMNQPVEVFRTSSSLIESCT